MIEGLVAFLLAGALLFAAILCAYMIVRLTYNLITKGDMFYDG